MKGLVQERDVSLYIHIPFCFIKCDYCAFYSLEYEKLDKNIIERFVSILLGQLDAVNREVKKPFHTIFIGGGNPGVIGYDNLKRILMLASANGFAKEVTIEINPENVSEEILSLKPYLTRVSVGIQSMKERSLRSLGRNTNREINRRALEILSQIGINFNVDLMTSIPNSTVDDTLEDIDEVVSYNPDHISFYCLTFEEGTPLLSRSEPCPEELEIEHLRRGWEKLASHGYEHYEISNFARNGKYSEHNLGYWRLGQYIGLGPTAESSLGYSEATSMRNRENLFDYLENPSFDCVSLTREETEEEFLLTSLRLKEGIDKKEYERRFGVQFDIRYGTAIEGLKQGDFENNEASFSLTQEGMLRLDSIILTLALSI